jgi:hypothetical protein
MKLRNLFYAAVCVMFSTAAFAQPEKFNYQGIARMANGAPIASQAIGMRISILNGSASGTPVYIETHTASTNQFGLYNVAIGGGTVVSGSMAGIAWGTGDKYVKVEIDPAGGTSYTDLGAAQLLSVPYALYSATGVPGPAGPQGPQGAQGPAGSANISGTTNRIIKFTSATAGGNSDLFENNGKVGIGNTAPDGKVHITGSFDDTVTLGGNPFPHVGLIQQNSSTSTTLNSRAILGYAGNSSQENQGLFGFANGGSASYNVGIFGYGVASSSSSGNSYGLYSYASGGSNNYGIYGNVVSGGFAGYFAGNVTVTGTLSKGGGTFKIDHPLDPENKYLYHSFVESPDMMNVYNGNITTDGNGTAVVTLPTYFEALNKDFRYQLTAIGTFAQAIVAEKIQGNSFVIKTDKPNVEVSWQVTGIRKDKFADAHRVVPEVEKEEEYKGHYLHAEEYGKPMEKSIDYLTMPPSARNLRK